ncbi:unnamed protein product, partial [Discosporangium mesarthrocarpum]
MPRRGGKGKEKEVRKENGVGGVLTTLALGGVGLVVGGLSLAIRGGADGEKHEIQQNNESTTEAGQSQKELAPEGKGRDVGNGPEKNGDNGGCIKEQGPGEG